MLCSHTPKTGLSFSSGLCRLPANAMMPSFASLRDFGNTSSASTWYTWSYIESTGGVKRGERVLQVCVTRWMFDLHKNVLLETGQNHRDSNFFSSTLN